MSNGEYGLLEQARQARELQEKRMKDATIHGHEFPTNCLEHLLEFWKTEATLLAQKQDPEVGEHELGEWVTEEIYSIDNQGKSPHEFLEFIARLQRKSARIKLIEADENDDGDLLKKSVNQYAVADSYLELSHRLNKETKN